MLYFSFKHPYLFERMKISPRPRLLTAFPNPPLAFPLAGFDHCFPRLRYCVGVTGSVPELRIYVDKMGTGALSYASVWVKRALLP